MQCALALLRQRPTTEAATHFSVVIPEGIRLAGAQLLKSAQLFNSHPGETLHM